MKVAHLSAMTQPEINRLFTMPDAWAGGSHGLALVLGQCGDASLAAAREAVWLFPDLDGCWLRNNVEPASQKRVTPGGVALKTALHGIARIPGAGPVACSTSVCREEDGGGWLHIYLPFGSLETVMPLGEYPFDDGGDLAWRDALDGWLGRIAEHVFRTVPFELALVGWLDAQPDALPGEPGEVPDERWIGYLVPGPDGLAWHPPNKGAPIS
jgi:hypothetical protein